MAGTQAGGKAAAATNKRKHGSDFYKKIGAMGGKNGRTGGFYVNRELARTAGRKGGLISRRGKVRKPIPTHLIKEDSLRQPSFADRLFTKLKGV